MISGPVPARIMHYIFCIVFQPYKVFGGIYYIDRVSTWEGDGPSRRKCQFWQTKKKSPYPRKFHWGFEKKTLFCIFIFKSTFLLQNFLSVLFNQFLGSFLACFNTKMCSWSNFEGKKKNCLSTHPPLKLWIRIQKNNNFFKGWPYFAMFFITFMLLIQIHYILGHTKKMPRFSGQFCIKMDEGGRLFFFFSRSFLPFFKKFHQIHYCSYCDSIKDDLLYIFSEQKFVFNIILLYYLWSYTILWTYMTLKSRR